MKHYTGNRWNCTRYVQWIATARPAGMFWSTLTTLMLLLGSTAILPAQGTKLFSWGNNVSGQLGDGTTTATNTPAQVGNGDWAFISGGFRHTLAIASDGSLWAWGSNQYGQLGIGSTASQTAPTRVGSGTDWALVSCGAYHTLAIKTDGSIWAWGRNSSGQLGLASTTSQTAPIQVGAASDWAVVSCGAFHTVAMKTDGSVYAWGSNWAGQVGDGSNVQRNAPVLVGTGWTSISAGAQHALGIKTDGSLWAWGYNGNGQLGDNSLINRWWPVQIGIDQNWTSVSCGASHTLAIRANGTLWAWGFNYYGQLGIGNTAQMQYTVPVGSETNWALVAGGGAHTLARKTDGTLWAWGSNSSGQLGNGTTGGITITPVQIGSRTDWTAVARGDLHSLALTSACTPLTPTITSSPEIPVNPGGAPNTIYLGYGPQSVTLTASGGTSYSWSPATGLSCTDCANPTASPTTTTTYTVTATNQSNCTGQASFTVNVVDIVCGNNPTKVLICHQCNNVQTVCIGESSVAAHLAHGDYLGGCQGAPKPNSDQTLIPMEVTLSQNYPNPFNPSTSISFGIPENTHVSLRVFNVHGRVVSELVNEDKQAGSYSVSFDASKLPSGVYLYRLEAGGQVRINTMTLMK